MKDYVTEVQTLESGESKLRYLDSALTMKDISEPVRDQLEDIYVKTIFETGAQNSSWGWKSLIHNTLDCNAFCYGENLSEQGHKKVVERFLKEDAFNYAEKYAKHVKVKPQFEDILAPARKKVFENEKERLISMLDRMHIKTGYLVIRISDYDIRKQLARAQEYSCGMDEKSILNDCVKLSKAKPETLIEVYKSIKDYSSALNVATQNNNPKEMAHALLALDRHFQYVKICLENNLEIYSSDAIKKLTQQQKEQLRPLAKQKGNLEFLAETYENKWVSHAIRTRTAKRNAKTSYELVNAHSRGDENYLNIILKRKLSPEMQFQAKKRLTRKYNAEISDLISYDRPGDGGPPMPPSDWALDEAKTYREKVVLLWNGDNRQSLMAENIKDEELKASSYEEEGDVSQAQYYYECAMRKAEQNLDVQKAKALSIKIQKLKEVLKNENGRRRN